jgi:uncharacterized protein (UPF0548 family)
MILRTLINQLTYVHSEHEKIIAVSGITGEDVWGDRVAQLSFVLYNSTSGQVRVEGVGTIPSHPISLSECLEVNHCAFS